MASVPSPAGTLPSHTAAAPHCRSPLRNSWPCRPLIARHPLTQQTTVLWGAVRTASNAEEPMHTLSTVSSSSSNCDGSCYAQNPQGVYQQLPDTFWNQRRILYNRMQHERDRVNRKARLKELRAQEEAQLALLAPAARTAYEAQMTELRIAAAKQQKAVLAHALQHGLRVIIDCSYCLSDAAAVLTNNRNSTSGSCLSDCHHAVGTDGQFFQQELQVQTGAQQTRDSVQQLQQPPEQHEAVQQQMQHLHWQVQDGQRQWQQQQQQQHQAGYTTTAGSPSCAAAAWQRAGDDASKEVRSLAKQIELSVSLNRRSSHPVALTVTSFTSHLEIFALHMGAHSWPLNKHQEHILDLYAAEDLIVLSPDSDEPLLELDPAKAYVIGGIVDRSVCKGLTSGFGSRYGLQTVRLPVVEYAGELGLGYAGASTRPVLNVSDVVVALIEYQRTGDWVHALREAVPARKRGQKQNSRCSEKGSSGKPGANVKQT